MNQTAATIIKQQDALLEAMGETRVMRRGTLSMQEYGERRTRRNGQGAAGPYALWQGYQDGKHFSRRVPVQDVPQFAREIETRKHFESLCARYVSLGEALAQSPDAKTAVEDALKKKPGRKSNKAKKSDAS